MPAVDITPPLPICNTMALPPFPTLGFGLSLDIPIPGIGEVFDVKLCCKVFQLPLILPPFLLDLSVVVDLSVVSDAFNNVIAEINRYLDLLPVICPKESTVIQLPI